MHLQNGSVIVRPDSRSCRILDLLFRFYTSWCLRIVPELFWRDMYFSLGTPCNATPPRTANYSPLLHNALLSVASAFSDDPAVKDDKARGRFAVKAKSFLDVECRTPSPSVVLGLSILANYHSIRGEPTLGYMYFGALSK